MIDLHLHTTASDGRSSPDQLVRRAWAAGLRTIAVTDHDTVAGLAAARAAAAGRGMTVIAGIEITAVRDGADIHLLGYFFDPAHAELAAFLDAQRADRRRRILEIFDRLDALGIVLPRAGVLRGAEKTGGRAIGRPVVARRLVASGHARDIADAFDRYLASGRPAFVPRRGASPADVIRLIAAAGGVSSFAHPGKLGLDHLVTDLAAQGLDAVEAWHPDHDEATTERYVSLARSLGLVMSGGSDYHGPGSGRAEALGGVTLPAEAFAVLAARATPAPRVP